MKTKLIILIISLMVVATAVSVLSISRVDFVSYDSILKKKAWIIYFSYDGADQRIVGTFSSDELNKKRSPDVGEKVKYDFQISMSLDEFTCEYPIQAQDEYVWDYDYQTKTLLLDVGAKEFIEECESNHPDWNKWGKGRCIEMCPPHPLPCITMETLCDWYCLWRTPKARYGRILDPRTHFSATVSLSSRGETKKATINSHTARSVSIDDTAHISWQGYLGTDEDCPTAQARGISAMFYNNKWILIDSDKYDDYKNFDMAQCFRDTATGRITFDECISEHDSLANKVLTPVRFNYYFSDIDEGSTARVENGVVVMDVPKLLKFPTFILRVDADWLGVVVPKGRPKIVDIATNPIKTGTEGIMAIEIKNIGDGVGTFDVSVVCDDPIQVVESPPRLTVGVGDTQKAYIRLYAETEEEITRECTITVYEVEDPTLKDVAKTFVEVKPIVMCFIEGQRRCNGNVIEECKNGKWVTVVTCEYGCEVVDGVPQCKKPRARCGNRICEPPEENAITCPIDCQPICGNKVCEPGETYSNCPQDCKHPCQITCPPFDINCYNRIIQCWISEITKSITLALTLLGIITIVGLTAYFVIKSRGWYEEWKKKI